MRPAKPSADGAGDGRFGRTRGAVGTAEMSDTQFARFFFFSSKFRRLTCSIGLQPTGSALSTRFSIQAL